MGPDTQTPASDPKPATNPSPAQQEGAAPPRPNPSLVAPPVGTGSGGSSPIVASPRGAASVVPPVSTEAAQQPGNPGPVTPPAGSPGSPPVVPPVPQVLAAVSTAGAPSAGTSGSSGAPGTTTTSITAPPAKRALRQLTRELGYGIISNIPPPLPAVTNADDMLGHMRGAIVYRPVPSREAVDAVVLNALDQAEAGSLRRAFDSIVEDSRNRVFRTIPGIDDNPGDARKRIADSISSDLPTFDDCLRRAGFSDDAINKYKEAKDANAQIVAQRGFLPVPNTAEAQRQQQLETFEKEFTAMRQAKIDRDVMLYATGAMRGGDIAKDEATAKSIIAADDAAYIKRILRLHTDQSLNDLERFGRTAEDLGRSLAELSNNSKLSAEEKEIKRKEMLEEQAKKLAEGLYVKLDKNGEKVFFAEDLSRGNIDRIIEESRHHSRIDWSDVPEEKRKEVEMRCLVNGKHVSINGVETPLSRTMPDNPEDYAQWRANIEAIKDPQERNRCMKALGKIVKERGPEAKRRYLSSSSPRPTIPPPGPPHLVSDTREFQNDLVRRLAGTQGELDAANTALTTTQPQDRAAAQARIQTLEARLANESGVLMNLAADPKNREWVRQALENAGASRSAMKCCITRLVEIKKNIEEAKKAEGRRAGAEQMVAAALAKLNGLPSPSGAVTKYLAKREQLNQALHSDRSRDQQIAQFRRELDDLARKVAEEPGASLEQKKAMADLQAADQTILTADGRAGWERHLATVTSDLSMLAGNDPALSRQLVYGLREHPDALMAIASPATGYVTREDQRQALQAACVESLDKISQDLQAEQGKQPPDPRTIDGLQKQRNAMAATLVNLSPPMPSNKKGGPKPIGVILAEARAKTFIADAPQLFARNLNTAQRVALLGDIVTSSPKGEASMKEARMLVATAGTHPQYLEALLVDAKRVKPEVRDVIVRNLSAEQRVVLLRENAARLNRVSPVLGEAKPTSGDSGVHYKKYLDYVHALMLSPPSDATELKAAKAHLDQLAEKVSLDTGPNRAQQLASVAMMQEKIDFSLQHRQEELSIARSNMAMLVATAGDNPKKLQNLCVEISRVIRSPEDRADIGALFSNDQRSALLGRLNEHVRVLNDPQPGVAAASVEVEKAKLEVRESNEYFMNLIQKIPGNSRLATAVEKIVQLQDKEVEGQKKILEFKHKLREIDYELKQLLEDYDDANAARIEELNRQKQELEAIKVKAEADAKLLREEVDRLIEGVSYPEDQALEKDVKMTLRAVTHDLRELTQKEGELRVGQQFHEKVRAFAVKELGALLSSGAVRDRDVAASRIANIKDPAARKGVIAGLPDPTPWGPKKDFVEQVEKKVEDKKKKEEALKQQRAAAPSATPPRTG